MVTDPIFDARIAEIDASADTGMHSPHVVAATVGVLRESSQVISVWQKPE